MISKKILKKLSNEESLSHKIIIWIGVHENEIFSQTILARILETKRSTLNYHMVALKKEKIIDSSLQLTNLGKKLFFELWKLSEMPSLRVHHTQLGFNLSKCPANYLKIYKNKILKPMNNGKYRGFSFKIKDFSCVFYSEKKIICYIKNIFVDTAEEAISALQIIGEEIKEIIEDEFEGVKIENIEMAKITFGHAALTNSFLAKKLDSYGYAYKGKSIDVDRSFSLYETEITDFKRNNIRDIEVLKQIDKDFQEFMERDNKVDLELQDMQ